jgi:hypothetical protein
MKVAASCSVLFALMLACAPATHYRMPESLRGYTVLIENRDSGSDALAASFRHHGMHVLRAVRGGRGPTAALLQFRFRDPAPGSPVWLHVRMFDTRTGVIVGAATLLLDSLPAELTSRSDLILDSLGLGRHPRRIH